MTIETEVTAIPGRESRRVGQELLPHALILLTRALGLAGGIFAQLYMAREITRTFGLEDYGYVMLAASVPALLPFASIGVTAPVINVFALYKNRSDHSFEEETLRTAFRTLVKVSVVLVCVALLFSVTSSWGRLFGIPAGERQGLDAVMVFVMGGVAVSLFGGVGMAVLVGLGRTLETLLYQALQPIALVVSLLLLKLTNAPVLYFAISVPVGQILVGAAAVWAANRRCDGILLSAFIDGLLHRHHHARILNQAAPMALIQTARAIGLQSDRLVLSHSSNAVQLGQYSVIAPMYQAGVSVASSLALSLWPIFTRKRAGAGARPFLVVTTMMFGAIGLVMAIGLTLTGPLAYRVVVNTDPPATELFALFGLLLFLTATLQPISMFLTDRRGLALQASTTVVTQVSNFLLSCYLAGPMGARGVVLASVICMSTLLAVPLLCGIIFLGAGENSKESEALVRS